MDLLFLQNIWFELLGSMSLVATAKKAGFQADIVIGNNKELLNAVKTVKPRIVAFSCVTGIQNWALGLCQTIKTEIDRNIVTLMGGPHPTFFPEILSESDCLDMICIGEGEDAILDVLRAERLPEDVQSTENIHVRFAGSIITNPVRPLMQNLDALPFVDRTSICRYPIIRDNPLKRLISSRGCPHNCSFCFNHSMKLLYKDKGNYVRRRSVDNVINEMKHIQSNWPVTTFLFEDDLFAVNKNWLLEFCEIYPSHFQLQFICYVRADSIDRESVKALKNAGCYNVVIGVETGDEIFRNKVLQKNITDDQLKRASSLFHEYRLNFCTTNILGLPRETSQQAFRTMSFTWELNPTFTWCSVFQPYPRTRLGDMVQSENLVYHLDVDSIEPNYHSGSVLRQTDINISVNLHKFFYVLFNKPSLFPYVKPLLTLPPNFIFTLIHRISFLLIYKKRWKISLRRAIQEGWNTSGFTRKKPTPRHTVR